MKARETSHRLLEKGSWSSPESNQERFPRVSFVRFQHKIFETAHPVSCRGFSSLLVIPDATTVPLVTAFTELFKAILHELASPSSDSGKRSEHGRVCAATDTSSNPLSRDLAIGEKPHTSCRGFHSSWEWVAQPSPSSMQSLSRTYQITEKSDRPYNPSAPHGPLSSSDQTSIRT